MITDVSISLEVLILVIVDYSGSKTIKKDEFMKFQF